MITIASTEIVSSQTEWWATAFTAGTLVAAIATWVKLFIDRKVQHKTIEELLSRSSREQILVTLNEFLIPMKVLRAESRDLYQIFAAKIREELKGKWEGSNKKDFFRTLRYLAEGNRLETADAKILTEIISVAKKQLKIIESSGSALTNPAFSELMGRLGAHIRALILASEHHLDGIPELAEKLVFPLEVDGALETEIRRLQDDYRIIDPNSNPKKEIDNMGVNHTDEPTIAYYDRNASTYFQQTAFLNLEDIYKVFRDSGLPRGGLILDAGCGVGRDTRHFIQNGYRVVSFDASKAMVELCREYPFAYCIQCDFRQIEFREEFDGVWACASLLHLGPHPLNAAIGRLIRALKPGGLFYASFKQRSGSAGSSSQEDSRTFHYYNSKKIEKLLSTEFNLEKVKIWTNPPRKEGDISEFTNYVFRKRRVIATVKGINA